MDNGIQNAITDVAGIKVGHYTDLVNGTGCTVLLCPAEGAVGGVDVRGPAPATRETDLLRPGHLVERVNAILLTGGSRMLEQYSGSADRFDIVGQLPEPGYYQTATLLPDGSVLIAGGYNRKPQSTDAAWVFRPAAR